MRVVVIGASAGLGRALSEALAARGHDLILVARDSRDLHALCTHLHLTHGISAQGLDVDAADTHALGHALRAAVGDGEAVQAIYLPMGLSRADDVIDPQGADLTPIWAVNFLSITMAIQTLLPVLTRGRHARIVGFGSVATIRGRGRNVIYAAAKRALSSYFESLRHHLGPEEVAVQFYQMGFIETQQLHGQASALPAISPQRAAQRILNDGARDFGTRFLPGYWGLIAPVLRLLPWAIFRRLKF